MCTCDCATSAVLPVITAPVSVPLAKVPRTSTTRGVLVSPALIPIYPTTTCRTRCDHACHARVDTSRLPLCFTPSHLTRQPAERQRKHNQHSSSSTHRHSVSSGTWLEVKEQTGPGRDRSQHTGAKTITSANESKKPHGGMHLLNRIL